MFNRPNQEPKTLEDLEDEEDIREAEAALKEIQEEGTISFEEMKKRLP